MSLIGEALGGRHVARVRRAAADRAEQLASSERAVRILAAGVLVFLAYPASEWASGGLSMATMAVTVAATVAAAGLYLVVVWHRAGPRWRIWLALAGMAVIGVAVPLLSGPFWVGLLLFPAIAAALVLRAWAGVTGAVAAAGVLAGEGVALGGDHGMVLSLAVVIVLGGLGLAGYVRLAEANGMLHAARAEVARLAAAEERSRLGRDLHDAVKQEMFVASMEIGTAQASLGANPDAARAHLAGASQAVGQAKAELSELVGRSRSAPPPAIDLTAALRGYLAEWSARHGIAAELDGSAGGALPGVVGEALVRAAQEALANVARHAQASSVRVTLAGDGHVQVRICDHGTGFDPDSVGEGHGLAIMAERLEAAGGTAEVASSPGKGTAVVLRWPATNRAPVSS